VTGKRRALLISTDTYEDSAFRQLDAPNADAEALGAVLTDPAIGAYEVKVLSNSASHQVNQAIDDFFDTANLEDQVILYFSGHGFKDDKGRLYLITTDSRRRLLASTAVSAQFIREQLDQCRSRRKIVVLDCCYAGAFPDGTTRSDDGIDVLERLSGRGSAVITATSAIGYALEGGTSPSFTEIREVAPSVFTGAFIEGLATGSADQDGDGLIDIDELYEYVYKKVREVAPQQTPGRRGNIEGILYVATSPRGPRPAQLSAEFSDAVQNPLPSIRLAVVRDLVTLCSGAHPGTVMAVHAALTQLADDDSRRVATAARSALEAIDERAQSIGIRGKTTRRTSEVASKAAQQEADMIRAEAREQSERMMNAAQEQAERAITSARTEAEKTLIAARTEADEVLTKTRRQSQQITGDARARAEILDRDAQQRHRQAMGSLVLSREELERRVDDLRAFEREYRSRFKAYLEGQLRDLEASILSSKKLPTLTRVDDLRAFEREYQSRLKAYLEGQLRDLEAGVTDS
jgi:cell division septum initiation protein DivIVA